MFNVVTEVVPAPQVQPLPVAWSGLNVIVLYVKVPKLQNEPPPVKEPAITTAEVFGFKVRLVDPDTPQLQIVVAAVPHVQVLAPRFIVRVPEPKTAKLLTLTVAVSPELPRVSPPVAVA